MWDVFISYASEDREVVKPLAELLKKAGLKVWLDEWTLELGDPLARKIDEGIRQSTYGVVILSKTYFAKEWPLRELEALITREVDSGKIILPVRHGMTHEECKKYSSIVASKLSMSIDDGLGAVVQAVLKVVRSGKKKKNRPNNKYEQPNKKSKEDVASLISRIKDNICPTLAALGQKATAEDLSRKASQLHDFVSSPTETPVVLLGVTGSGKTSLMNAILKTSLGIAGGGGSQSAVSLIVAYSREKYHAVASYITLDEIRAIVNLARIDSTRRDTRRRPDEQGASKYSEFLSSVLVDPGLISSQDREIEISDLHKPIADLVKQKKSETTFSPREVDQMTKFIKEHTNSRGKYWSITAEVRITGPFLGLRPNVTIMDLPGLGDLNALRIEKTRVALKKADQVIVVVGERGFTEDVRQMLGETQIISYLLTNPTISQVTVVGTRLDASPTNRRDLEDLGLSGRKYRNDKIVHAKFGQWTILVKKQWSDILTTWYENTQQVDHRRKYVDMIIENTDFIPCSPTGYLSLNRLEDFIGVGDVKKMFPKLKGDKEFRNTGIPAVRDSIYRLAEKQELLRQVKVGRLSKDLKKSTQESCSRLVSVLRQDAKFTDRTKQLYQEAAQRIKNSTRKRGEQKLFQRLYDDSERQLKAVEIIIQEGWKDLNQGTVEELLFSHIGVIYFQTLIAALRRKGIFVGKGKKKVAVNIPGKIVGPYVTDPITAHVYAKVLPDFVKNARIETEKVSEEFIDGIKQALSQTRATAKNDLLASFEKQAMSILGQYDDNIAALRERSLSQIDQKEIDVDEIALQSIGKGFEHVLESARVEKGRGARKRIIVDIAELSIKTKPSIVRKSASEFSQHILNWIQERGNQVSNALIFEQQTAVDKLIEMGDAQFGNMSSNEKKQAAKKLQEALGSLGKVGLDEYAISKRKDAQISALEW